MNAISLSDLIFGLYCHQYQRYFGQIKALMNSKSTENIELALHLAVGMGIPLPKIDFLGLPFRYFPEILTAVEGIKNLRLAGNEFQKQLPGNWISASSIQELDISFLSAEVVGMEEDCFFQEFKALKKLIATDIDWPQLPKCLPALKELKSIKLTKGSFQQFPALVQLQELRLLQCHQLKALPKDEGQGFELRILQLHQNNFSYIAEMETGSKTIEIIQDYIQKHFFEPIFSYSKLKRLNLDNCRINQLPSGWKQLANSLEELSLRETNLSGLPEDLGSLTNLKKLDLLNNPFKVLPEVITKLHNLQVLLLGSTPYRERLKAPLPNSFEQLQQLKRLDLHRVEWQELPLAITQLKQLTELRLINCAYIRSINYFELIIPQLQHFEWSGGVITRVPDFLKQAHQLKSLDLSNQQFQYIPAWLFQLPALEKINLSGNRKLHFIYTEGIENSTIQSLDLRDCPLLFPIKIPEHIRLIYAKSVPSEQVDLYAMPIEKLPVDFFNQTHIKELRMRKMHPDFEWTAFFKQLPKLKNLKTLDLSENHFEFDDAMGEAIAKLPQLNRLKLCKHNLEELPMSMASSLIENLDLSYCSKFNIEKNLQLFAQLSLKTLILDAIPFTAMPFELLQLPLEAIYFGRLKDIKSTAILQFINQASGSLQLALCNSNYLHWKQATDEENTLEFDEAEDHPEAFNTIVELLDHFPNIQHFDCWGGISSQQLGQLQHAQYIFMGDQEKVLGAPEFFQQINTLKKLEKLDWECLVFKNLEAVETIIPQVKTLKLQDYNEHYYHAEGSGWDIKTHLEYLLNYLPAIFPNARIYLDEELL